MARKPIKKKSNAQQRKDLKARMTATQARLKQKEKRKAALMQKLKKTENDIEHQKNIIVVCRGLLENLIEKGT